MISFLQWLQETSGDTPTIRPGQQPRNPLKQNYSDEIISGSEAIPAEIIKINTKENIIRILNQIKFKIDSIYEKLRNIFNPIDLLEILKEIKTLIKDEKIKEIEDLKNELKNNVDKLNIKGTILSQNFFNFYIKIEKIISNFSNSERINDKNSIRDMIDELARISILATGLNADIKHQSKPNEPNKLNKPNKPNLFQRLLNKFK